MKNADQKKTECFGALRKCYGGSGKFAMTSIEDMRKAGKEAGKALERMDKVERMTIEDIPLTHFYK